MTHNDRDLVKDKLKERIEDLCRKLLPAADAMCGRKGRLWVAYNPVKDASDASTPELKVALTRDVGAWKCWRSGDKGDVFSLISYVLGHTDFGETMRWARDFCGIARLTPAELKALEKQARERKKRDGEEAERKRLWAIGKAEELFMTGMMLGAGSAAEAHARKYFAARSCPLADVKNLDEATFRFAVSTEYWTLAEWQSDERGRRWKVKDGPKYPAIHSAMRGPLGQVAACHCTFLDPVWPMKISLGKAHPPKLMFGQARGAVIRLTHGPEGVPPELATCSGPVVICEGVETGLSLAAAIAEARIWAAGSLSNMGNAPVWMDCVGQVVVARDNNDGNAQAQRQLDGVLEQLAAAGKPIEVIASHVGDDFNDLAKGEE